MIPFLRVAIVAAAVGGLAAPAAAVAPTNWQQLYQQERAAHQRDVAALNAALRQMQATISTLSSRMASLTGMVNGIQGALANARTQRQQLRGLLSAAQQANAVLQGNLSSAQGALNAAGNDNQTLKGQLSDAVAALDAERSARQTAEQARTGEQQKRQEAEKQLADEQQARQDAEQSLAAERQKCQDAEQAAIDEQRKRQDAEGQLAEAMKRTAELENPPAPAPIPATRPAPKLAAHTTRFLRVKNATGKAIKLSLQYRTPAGAGQWAWVPAAPGGANDALVFDLVPGAKADLEHEGKRVHASRVRVWATGDGVRWAQYKDQDLWLVDEAGAGGKRVYSAAGRETYTLEVPPPPTP